MKRVAVRPGITLGHAVRVLCRGSVQHWKGRLLSQRLSFKGLRRLDNRRWIQVSLGRLWRG